MCLDKTVYNGTNLRNTRKSSPGSKLYSRSSRRRMGNASLRLERGLFVTMFGVLVFLLFFGTRYILQREAPREEITFQARVIEPGDTLWELACNTGIKSDTREIVSQIMRYNALGNSAIVPGQTIYVPVSAPKLASR
ncbi:MAG: LysM peptidoglycan-binding domain-containing protein [Desulfitobacteriaceae bacterium]